jgi:dolichyl-diphosphooligosaccharide--protein glycosyltransferase
MAAWSGIPVSKYIGAVYQPQGEQLVPVQMYLEPYFKSMTARLYFFDGTEETGGEGVGLAYRGMALEGGATVPVLTKSPLITQNYSELKAFVADSKKEGDIAVVAATSPANSPFPLEALQHYRLVHESETPVTSDGQKRVKTFEHVPGAVVQGSAPAGTTVSAGAAIMTNENRAFVYRQSNVTDSSGKFTLVLPYSTEGPIASGTNFDTKPLGPYQISVGDKTYEVRVPEEYVLNGSVITI